MSEPCQELNTTIYAKNSLWIPAGRHSIELIMHKYTANQIVDGSLIWQHECRIAKSFIRRFPMNPLSSSNSI